MKKKLLSILALAVIVLPLLLASLDVLFPNVVAATDEFEYIFPNVIVSPPSNNNRKVGDEVTEARSEFSKTYYQGGGRYSIVIGGDTQHWRENWYDETEPWKDVDLTWEPLFGGPRQITKAPYILLQVGNIISFTDRRTGKVSTIELLSVKPNTPFEIVPFVDGFSFQHKVANLNVPFEAQFRVLGDLVISTRAYDDIGEFELETTLAGNILTEKLSKPKDKTTGKERAVKGKIRIDPTVTVQPAVKDTLLNGGSEVGKDTNYGTNTLLAIARDEFDPFTYYRSILHFTLPANPGGFIDSIRLYLYKYFDLAGYTCPIAPVYSLSRTDWVELEATWNVYKAATNWTTGGGDFSATVIDTTNDNKTFGNYGWEYWVLRGTGSDNPLATDWTDNVHLLLKYPNSTTHSYAHWYSSDYAVDPALRPKLVIEYTVAAAGTEAATLQTATKATLNGVGPDAVTTTVGFVWDTISRGNPGNLAPALTLYSDSWTSGAGVYQNLPFDHRITGLDYTTNPVYYYRAAAECGGVWGYGDELELSPFVDIWNSGAIVTQVPAGPAATGRNCIVADGYLYAVEQSYRWLAIYNVANPELPVLVSMTDLDFSGGCDLEKIGNYLIITMVGYSDTPTTGITVWDVSIPASPSLVKTLNICSGGVHGLFRDGNTLYVAGWDTNSIYSIDVTYPASATLLDTLTDPVHLPGAHDISVDSGYAYVSCWNAGGGSYGFAVVNVANPSNMLYVASGAINWKGSHNTKNGDYVYVGSHQPSQGLKVFDVSNPLVPVETDHLGNILAYASLGYWNDWYGDYLVSVAAPGGNGGTHVIDVSNPAALAFVAQRYDTGTYARGNIFTENGYLFLPYNVQIGGFWQWRIENVELVILKARVLTSAATSVEAQTARINAVIDDAGEATCDIQFRYKRIADSTWIETAWQSGKVTDGTAYADLTGLTPSTQYHFQVRARNSVGEWQWSASLPFTTIALGPPVITTEAASRIAYTTARLNSVLTSSGGLPCTIRFGWGNATQAAIIDYEYYETLPGTYTHDQHPYLDVSSLNISTLYYFRVEATNANGVSLGAELTFTTIAFTGTPQNFNGIPADDHINLSWDALSGASNYLIRYKSGSYPTGVTDGTQAYFGSSVSTVHTGLTSGTTYYYMLWGESGGTYSSNATLMMTTTAGAGGGATPDYTPPSEIARWLTGTDYTNVAGLGFIYTIINNVAGSINMPYGTAWFVLWVGISFIMGLMVLIKSNGKMLPAASVMTVLLVLGWMMKLVPFWIPLIGGILIIASFMGHRETARG